MNLWEKPQSSIEALTLADLIKNREGVSLTDEAGTENLTSGDRKWGEVVLCTPERIRDALWGEEAAFARTDLSRIAYHLIRGELYVPGRGVVGNLPMVRFGLIGTVGPDRRDIHDGFDQTRDRTAYRALWGHNTDEIRAIAQKQNRYLSALPRAKPGRSLRDAKLLWSRAGRLMIAERLRLNTTRLVSVRLRRAALSNTWWPCRITNLEGGMSEENAEKIIALWLNSTLGVISLIGARVDTEGAWVDLKKPILQNLMVPNPAHSMFRGRRLTKLVSAYDKLANQELRPLPQIADDPVRARIDTAIARALEFTDDIEITREMLAREPILTGSRR